jgi:ankyrin repeat protein
MTWTKLHYLCGAQRDPFNTTAILKHIRGHPEEIVEVDDHGYTPLHVEAARAGDHPSREEVIRVILQENPDIVMKKDLKGNTPIHLALCQDIESNMVKLMLDACPRVAFEKDKEGLLPLHVACRHCADNNELIKILIEANPAATLSRTKMGNIVQKKNGVSPSLHPLEAIPYNQHIALDGRTSSAWKELQVKSVAECRFQGHQIRDGSYPLHMAIKSAAPKEILEMLIKEAPEVTSLTDKFGQTCLHMAVKNGEIDDPVQNSSENTNHPVAIEVVDLIHSIDSNQVKAKDQADQLPLHAACQAGCSIDVMEYLVRAYPDAVNVKDKSGRRPLDVAVTFGLCSKDVTDFLSKLSDTADVESAQ